MCQGVVVGLLVIRQSGIKPHRGQPRVEKDFGLFLSVPVQVETIRDAYMVVAGVPNKTTFHAHHICDMALDMLSSIDHLKDPSTGDNIQIRVGELRLMTGLQKRVSRNREELPINFQSFRVLSVTNVPVRIGCPKKPL